MRPESDVRRVFKLWDDGLPKAAIARETGVSRAQVRYWLARGLDHTLGSPMRKAGIGGSGPCRGSCALEAAVDAHAYAYLLGQYLGDGCISAAPRHVYRLRITMCDAYPRMREECELAIRAAMPGRAVGRIQREGCTEVYADSKHWPCLFPQHGPGRKHERRIVLEQWQQRIALDLQPMVFLRGLIHSDGCRCTNRVNRRVLGGVRQYAYPRYFFVNESRDIRGLFTEACRRLDIDYRYSKRNTISVARRESVSRLDSFIGPER
jgi:Homeodomain-like domain